MTKKQISKDPYTSGWIEDDLYYRGEAPPKDDRWSDRDWVYLPHENYIPISKARVIRALLKEVEDFIDNNQAEKFIDLLEGIYHFHYHKVLNELKEDYEYFSPAIGDQMREGISDEELDQRQRNFMINLFKLMIRGNFNPLGEKEYAQAEEHNYLLDLPIEVNWKIKDPQIFTDLFQYANSPQGKETVQNKIGVSNLEEYLNIPQIFNQRILVFHRGIEPTRVEDTFLLQKINRLTEGVFEWVFHKFTKSKTSSKKSSNTQEAIPFAQKNTPFPEELSSGTVFLPRWIRRISLHNIALPFRSLFKPTLLQEPTMERVIAIFRLHPQPQRTLMQKLPFLHRFAKPVEPQGVDRTLYVKLFQNIPLADLEIIFPEKTIHMRSFDKFMLFFLGTTGIFLGVLKGLESGKGILFIILSVLALLVIKTITRFVNTRRRYMLQMSQDLYHKNLDNNVGVIQYLVDNIEDQEFKESFIAYMLLHKSPTPLTAKELDAEAEVFINKYFKDVEIDFEIDDALAKITEAQESPQMGSTELQLPLITTIIGEDGVVRYQAKNMSDALTAMDKQWDNFFRY